MRIQISAFALTRIRIWAQVNKLLRIRNPASGLIKARGYFICPFLMTKHVGSVSDTDLHFLYGIQIKKPLHNIALKRKWKIGSVLKRKQNILFIFTSKLEDFWSWKDCDPKPGQQLATCVAPDPVVRIYIFNLDLRGKEVWSTANKWLPTYDALCPITKHPHREKNENGDESHRDNFVRKSIDFVSCRVTVAGFLLGYRFLNT